MQQSFDTMFFHYEVSVWNEAHILFFSQSPKWVGCSLTRSYSTTAIISATHFPVLHENYFMTVVQHIVLANVVVVETFKLNALMNVKLKKTSNYCQKR